MKYQTTNKSYYFSKEYLWLAKSLFFTSIAAANGAERNGMERHRSTFFLVMVFYRSCIVDDDGGGGGEGCDEMVVVVGRNGRNDGAASALLSLPIILYIS